MSEKQELPQAVRLLLALSALAATQDASSTRSTQSKKWYKDQSTQWLRSICKLVQIPHASLPPSITSEAVRESASDQISEWSNEEQERIAAVLVEASLAGDPDKDDKEKAKEENALKYTPLAKGLSHKTLEYLGLNAGRLLGEAERNLAGTLFKALKAAQEGSSAKVEESRQKQAQGWGGSLGRKLATGAGVVAGGVLIGVTGGLAAPAIAALLAPLGIGGLLAGGAAPVVLGTLFGVGGGGLAGRRVRERWRGVEEFGFVEIGAGTKATTEEVEDLKQARERYQARKKKGEAEAAAAEGADKIEGAEKSEGKAGEEGGENGEKTEDEVSAEVEKDRLKLEEKLLGLSLSSTATIPESPRQSLDSAPTEKDIAQTNKPPSLTATIVVPGLLTVSKTEGITAWRAICAPEGEGVLPTTSESEQDGRLDAWKDGRDVYLLRFETATMLKSGRDIDHWVTGKLKSKLKGEIIKRTVLSAYFAAVSLPMTAYSLASMGLDNTWMQAQDRAKKAGRLLGEVLEKKVQGERPVILVGTSLGALTILTALQYLASLPGGDVPGYVESAYLISLPAAPSPEEWINVRKVVARRVVNAYSESDWVLAGVVRLHEVVTRAATLSSGVKVAGLGPVNQPGIDDVDVSSTLKGHMEIQTKLSDILKVINVDG